MHDLNYLDHEDCERLPPVRGIVLTHNVKGENYDLVDCLRWVRLNGEIYKTLKIDIVDHVDRGDFRFLRELAEEARELGMRVSLRTDCADTPPANFAQSAKDADLLDVFLTPANAESPQFAAWLDACVKSSLPVRVQVQPPFPSDLESYASRIAAAGVAVVNVALRDPFMPAQSFADPCETIAQINRLAALINGKNIEANIIWLPLCLAEPDNLFMVQNRPQYFRDHQQYNRLSYEFAETIHACSPAATARAVVIPLGQNRSMSWTLDQRILRWITGNAWVHSRALIIRKLTRVVRMFGMKGRPIEGNETAYERELARLQKAAATESGPKCSQCRFRHICDHESPEWQQLLPGIEVAPQPGEAEMSPLHLSRTQRKWYDEIDAERLKMPEIEEELAERARQIALNVLPTREVDSDSYEIENQYTHHMPGGNRWYAFSNGERLSTPLAKTEAPLTVSVTIGGGIAELAGFSFGRHCKILCPMVTYSHQLVMHVDEQGRYVMLRDGKRVRPLEFEGSLFVPNRLAGVLEPRLSLWNIDGSLVTQTVLVWEGNPAAAAVMENVKYSVFIVTTRYARRLQAVLQSLAHQRGFDLGKLEVIVGYVPGIDATDDVLDSMQMAYPQLRIVRAPFQENYAKSKGFLINESVRLASGEWVVLLDSDTLVGPDTFARVDAVADSCMFIAPDGRKMLTPQMTAEVLLGRIRPWEQWEQLLQGEGEFRAREAKGVPIGFFQAVRKSCMEKIRYGEMDHFEGADWWFGNSMRKEFGPEHRLSGMPVIHLDHGGSQWYGTSKHR